MKITLLTEKHVLYAKHVYYIIEMLSTDFTLKLIRRGASPCCPRVSMCIYNKARTVIRESATCCTRAQTQMARRQHVKSGLAAPSDAQDFNNQNGGYVTFCYHVPQFSTKRLSTVSMSQYRVREK